MTVSTAHSETEIKESVREFQSLTVSGEETGLVNISPSKCSLKCQKVMISGIPDWVLTVKTLNIGTPRLTTVVVLNIKQFNFTMQ